MSQRTKKSSTPKSRKSKAPGVKKPATKKKPGPSDEPATLSINSAHLANNKKLRPTDEPADVANEEACAKEAQVAGALNTIMAHTSGEAVGGRQGDAVFLGDGRYQVGDEPICLDGQQANVLQVLVELRAATLGRLRDKTGVQNPSHVLTTICKSHPKLAPFIKLPGRKSRGGYSTSIVDGRNKQT
jgi:hypothetical protein